MKKKILNVLLVVIILCISVVPCYATNTQQKISEATQEKKNAQSKLDEQRNKISGLEAKKNELETYLEDLNSQLTELSGNLEQIQKKAKEKETDLERIKGSLERAKASEKQQYGNMKKRIQYMYEKSNSTYIEMLLGAESFADFLNKADTISQITTYDRTMLNDFVETKEIIAKQETQAENDKKEILELQQQQQDKLTEIQQLVESTDSKIHTYKSEITQAQSTAAAFLEKIEEQKNSIDSLIAKAEEEKAQKAKQEASIKKAEKEQEVKKAQKEETNSGQEQSSESQKKPENTNTSTGNTIEKDEASNDDKVEQEVEESGNEVYLGTFKLTAYCWCAKCNGRAGHPTASGSNPVVGRTVAMAGVPFGTKLRINGHVYTVEDRGTSYGHVDVFHGSHSAALTFGLQYAEVYRVN